MQKARALASPETVCLNDPSVLSYWNTVRYRPCDRFTDEAVSGFAVFPDGRAKDGALPVFVKVEPIGGADSYFLDAVELPEGKEILRGVVRPGVNPIRYLKVNRHYLLRTVGVFWGAGRVISEREIVTVGARRMNPLASVSNMRDLGEIPTEDGRKLKQGILYRCGRMQTLSPEDRDLLEEVLSVSLVVSLAGHTEDDALFSPGTELWHPYNLEQWDKLRDVGTRQYYLVALRKILAALASGRVVLYHCNGGADRTGLLSAIIEGLCGVGEDAICRDYELTSFSFYKGKPLSRTRIGNKTDDPAYPSGYRDVGFDDGMAFVRKMPGEIYADKWRAVFADPALAEPITENEVALLRKLLVE